MKKLLFSGFVFCAVSLSSVSVRGDFYEEEFISLDALEFFAEFSTSITNTLAIIHTEVEQVSADDLRVGPLCFWLHDLESTIVQSLTFPIQYAGQVGAGTSQRMFEMTPYFQSFRGFCAVKANQDQIDRAIALGLMKEQLIEINSQDVGSLWNRLMKFENLALELLRHVQKLAESSSGQP